MIGYIIMMVEFLGFGPIDKTGVSIFEFGLYLLFYGLYFGVLSRDIIQECSDRMASAVGYYNPGGIPQKHLRDNICAICGSQIAGTGLSRFSDDASQAVPDPNEAIISLDCRHQFHEFCIRGWCIIGKKDMCPYCKEKVDLKLIRKNNPWDTQEAFYLSFLDGLRYFLVFQPIVIFAVQGFAHLTGMDKPSS